MFSEITSILERLHQPEYTGENRCIPCTVVNVVIAVATSVLISLVAPPIGLITFVSFAGIIYLRGYLIPGTPTLTKRYFPDRMLRWFDKPTSEAAYAAHNKSEGEIDAEGVLLAIGAIEECTDEPDLCLSPEFSEVWNSHSKQLQETGDVEDILGAVLDMNVNHVSVNDRATSFVVYADRRQVGQWESHAAFIADMAAEQTLREYTHGWSEFPADEKSVILASLRVFVEQCPTCGGSVQIQEEIVESCCRSREVIASACQECGARLFEIETPNTTDPIE